MIRQRPLLQLVAAVHYPYAGKASFWTFSWNYSPKSRERPGLHQPEHGSRFDPRVVSNSPTRAYSFTMPHSSLLPPAFRSWIPALTTVTPAWNGCQVSPACFLA